MKNKFVLSRKDFINQIRSKKTCLCIGLDSDIEKIPSHLKKIADPVFEFNRQIIEATQELCVAYKLNIAFYESRGTEGWTSLEKTLKAIPKNILTIADAKRGDIGNSSRMYAKTFFEKYDFDAVTVAPYMGSDSVAPFLEYPPDGRAGNDKWVFVLALTSNEGSKDFQFIKSDEKFLFEHVIEKVKSYPHQSELGFVVGATQSEYIEKVRKIVPENFLLIPGVGAQGGDLDEVCKKGMNRDCGLLINSSREIIYAESDRNFAIAARNAAKRMNDVIKKHFV